MFAKMQVILFKTDAGTRSTAPIVEHFDDKACGTAVTTTNQDASKCHFIATDSATDPANPVDFYGKISRCEVTSNCDDTCATANNGVCNEPAVDYGTGLAAGQCAFGTDCTDCGSSLAGIGQVDEWDNKDCSGASASTITLRLNEVCSVDPADPTKSTRVTCPAPALPEFTVTFAFSGLDITAWTSEMTTVVETTLKSAFSSVANVNAKAGSVVVAADVPAVDLATAQATAAGIKFPPPLDTAVFTATAVAGAQPAGLDMTYVTPYVRTMSDGFWQAGVPYYDRDAADTTSPLYLTEEFNTEAEAKDFVSQLTGAKRNHHLDESSASRFIKHLDGADKDVMGSQIAF